MNVDATASFSHALLHRADGDRLAIVDGERAVTYFALRAGVARLGGALAAEGIADRDRVVIFGEPSAFTISAYLAAIEAGGIAVPLGTSSTDAELDAQIEAVAPRFAFLHEDVAARFASLGWSTGVEHIIVGPEPLRASHASGVFERAPDDEDLIGIARISFASSNPANVGDVRVVHVGHDNLRANTEAVVDALSLRPGDRTVLVLPLSDAFGASVLHSHLWASGTVHIGPTPALPEKIVHALEESRATGFHGDGDTYASLLEEGDFAQRALPHLRYVAQARGKLPEALVDALVGSAVPEVYLMYGQAEATWLLSVVAVHADPDKRASVGRGLPGTTLTVLSPDGTAAAPGETGDVVATGPGVTRGYLDDLEASAERFRDGSLYTGDVGTIDEEGFVFLADSLVDSSSEPPRE
ncbi:MAG: AMP-binding protein [Deltaproteobacteria bacterium]|nr:AMP-binding protein [Deltaproteobacteria bacterium]